MVAAVRAVTCSVIVALAGLSGLAAASTSAPRILSLAANGPASDRVSPGGMELAASAGARGALLSYTWAELEPAPRRYDAGQLYGIRYLSEKRGLKLLLGLQVVDTTVKATPRDLVHTRFDSQRMKERFHALVDALGPYLNRNVQYISIGNGVDMYLSRNPEAWPAYLDFYRDSVQYLHEVAPWIAVGATATFGGVIRKARGRMLELNRASDVQLVTYFPVAGDFQVRSPGVPLRDFKALLRISGDRPLVLPEVGYPDSAALGSSELKQAAFVRSLFAAWKRLAGRMPFVNYLYLHDLAPRACDEITGFYGHTKSNFKEFVCSIGLRHSSGTPKPAWSALVREAARLR